MKIVVIGAGVGGLTAAAVLARRGLDVTVLENHIYPGGCAGTFYHRGFRFDAGATLAGGFYDSGPMARVAAAAGIDDWGGEDTELTMSVHLPDGAEIHRWSDRRRHAERDKWFSSGAAGFWRWQERTADALWGLAESSPPWPPQTPRELLRLAGLGTSWLSRNPSRLRMLADFRRRVADRLPRGDDRLRLFIDAQLLIAAQTTSEHTNALYGASALDLPRRGVRHFRGGMGAIAERLAQAVEQAGGRVLYRQKASAIRFEKGRPVAVETARKAKKGSFDADVVVANLTPQDLSPMLEGVPRNSTLSDLSERTRGTDYGAFVVHVGLPRDLVPDDATLHHQIIVSGQLREGNSAYLSLSPSWDPDRAPTGFRAATISTHTLLDTWWKAFDSGAEGYAQLKSTYADRLLSAAAQALPAISRLPEYGPREKLVFPGTPVTFQRFTSRTRGWVGGYPQESITGAVGPAVAPHVWMVGDSIFPGQSTAAVAMGGLRVAKAVLDAV